MNSSYGLRQGSPHHKDLPWAGFQKYLMDPVDTSRPADLYKAIKQKTFNWVKGEVQRYIGYCIKYLRGGLLPADQRATFDLFFEPDCVLDFLQYHVTKGTLSGLRNVFQAIRRAMAYVLKVNKELKKEGVNSSGHSYVSVLKWLEDMQHQIIMAYKKKHTMKDLQQMLRLGKMMALPDFIRLVHTEGLLINNSVMKILREAQAAPLQGTPPPQAAPAPPPQRADPPLPSSLVRRLHDLAAMYLCGGGMPPIRVNCLISLKHPGSAFGEEDNRLQWLDDGKKRLKLCLPTHKTSDSSGVLLEVELKGPMLSVLWYWCKILPPTTQLGYVFANSRGQPFTEACFSKYFRKTLFRLGGPGAMSPQKCRHMWATWAGNEQQLKALGMQDQQGIALLMATSVPQLNATYKLRETIASMQHCMDAMPAVIEALAKQPAGGSESDTDEEEGDDDFS
jgi:hypothetical protein